MSSTCGNCNCVDKSQCVKKGNEYVAMVIGTEKSNVAEVMEFSRGYELCGKCKCGANCTCTDINCGD